jgi:hypothetical protein
MSDPMITAVKLLFLLGFTLHNLEESLWLPEWSKYAERFHKPVKRNPFIFAVIVITIFGYLITLADILVDQPEGMVHYIYLGFIGMMGLNAIFPHLAATVMLKKYAPGLLTGLLLNLPISLIIITHSITQGVNIFYLVIAVVLVAVATLQSLKHLFRIGEILIDT